MSAKVEDAPWTCKICNEVFNNPTDYQEHWKAELELLDAPWTECSFPISHQRSSVLLPEVMKVSSGTKSAGKHFRNCFELADKEGRGKADKGVVRSQDKALLVFSETKGRCPLCNKLLPLAELQKHVEEELETTNKGTADKGVEVKPVPKGLLVLGDDPQPRKRIKCSQTENKKPVLTFNHYADGKGWWSEDMVGTDAAEVGCQMSWEGFGSVHFED